MKLRTLSVAFAVAGLGFTIPGHAAGISDDVIRIGMITDMSSVYSDIDGAGGGEAVRMAIEDAGGQTNGKKIEIMIADHQNKADIASSRARAWFAEHKIDIERTRVVEGTRGSERVSRGGGRNIKKQNK